MMLPPPIQGLGLSDGFQMQVELINGTFDYERLQSITTGHRQRSQPAARGRQRCSRLSAPMCRS